MKSDIHNLEHIDNGNDHILLTQEMGRRISMLNTALINVSIANKYSSSPHLLNGSVDLVKHYQRKDYSQITVQDKDENTVSSTYEKEINKLDPKVRTDITPLTDIEQARADVALYAAQGMLDIEDYLASQIAGKA
ncbi:MAG: hypothetical protein WCJ60_02990 [bacterium]